MNKYELIDIIIVNLDRLKMQGVDNWTIVLDAIQRLSALKNGLKEEEKQHELADQAE